MKDRNFGQIFTTRSELNLFSFSFFLFKKCFAIFVEILLEILIKKIGIFQKCGKIYDYLISIKNFSDFRTNFG